MQTTVVGKRLIRFFVLLAALTAWAGAQEVTLLDPGAEPRQELRYRLEAGMSSTAVITQRMVTRVEMDGAAMPGFDMPPIRMVLSMVIDEVTAEGIHYSFAYDEVELLVEETPGGVPSAILEAMRQGFGALTGVTGRMVTTDRGLVQSAEMQGLEGVAPEMASTFGDMEGTFTQFAAPFPEEAVGRGARWESRSTVTQGGLSVEQTTLFELVSLEGDRIELAVTLTQLAGEGALEAAPGQEIDILSVSGTGSGTYRFDLTSLWSEGELAMTSESEMAMNMGDAEGRIRSFTTVDMSWVTQD